MLEIFSQLFTTLAALRPAYCCFIGSEISVAVFNCSCGRL